MEQTFGSHVLFPQKSRFESKKVLALDCEMVEVLKGSICTASGPQELRSSALARCSIVDWDGNTLLDLYVKPNHK
jgi:hypothetical protein